MKILHTSDWHLGHVLYNYDRTAEQRDMLRQIAKLASAELPDALLVSGDVFHNATPSAATQQLFVEGLLHIRQACPEMPIVLTAGNHDSAARLEATAQLWKLTNVTIVGSIARHEDRTPDYDRHIVEVPGKGWVVAIPHAYPFNFPAPIEVDRNQRQQHFFQTVLDRVAERNADQLPVVLMAHLAVAGGDFTGHDNIGTIERNADQLPVVLMAHLAVAGGDFTGHDNIGTIDTIPIEALGKGYDYVALGHIHQPQTLDAPKGITNGRVRYCGTPLPVSFDEQCEHSVSIVNIQGHDTPQVTTHKITNLKPLHTIPAKDPVSLDEALQLLADFNDKEPAYIRLNITAQGYVPVDARSKAADTTKGKACRFCVLKVTDTTPQSTCEQQQMTVAQLQQTNPLDVARSYILEKTGVAMTEEQERMFNEAVQQVNENRNN